MTWQKILAQGFSSSQDLLAFLELPPDLFSQQAELSFTTRVPLGFAARMQKKNPDDPLLLQVLAQSAELTTALDYKADPLEEKKVNPIAGLLHKYYGRVLLTLVGACAVNCRYCFRRHFPYGDNNPGRAGWKAVLDYIEATPTIHEVILSGGDPLLVNDRILGEFIDALDAIEHVTTLRFHTRIPVVLPERINETFCRLLADSRLNKVIVLHSNHPQEIDESVKIACMDLKRSGCHLLNQSVLLKNINNDATILADLSHQLFNCGVLPYYLHVLDKVSGAQHFDLPLSEVQSLYKQLQLVLPGYLLPRLAREDPGKGSKTLLFASE